MTAYMHRITHRLALWARYLRFVLRYYWTGGAMARVSPPSPQAMALAEPPRFARLVSLLRDPNLVHPLTPVIIALRAGKARAHREAPYQNAFVGQRMLGKKTPGARLVGRAMLTKYPSQNVYSDVEWAPGYVTRKQRLAARRTAKLFREGKVA